MNLAIGDESTPGYDPRSNNLRTEAKSLTKALGNRTVSSGLRGAAITVGGRLSLAHQLKQFSLAAYDRILLFYGANDYLRSEANLTTVSRELVHDVQLIRKSNRYLKIYGILPLPMYDHRGRNLDRRRGAGAYTLHDLKAMLSVTYSNQQVAVLNWSLLKNPVVNGNNYTKRLKWGRFPTQKTYHLMASRIGQFVKRCENARPNRPTLRLAPRKHRPRVGFGKLSAKRSQKR